MMTQEEMEKCKWEPTSERCVMLCVDTGKFHFICETEMLDETPYDTERECVAALKEYAKQL